MGARGLLRKHTAAKSRLGFLSRTNRTSRCMIIRPDSYNRARHHIRLSYALCRLWLSHVITLNFTGRKPTSFCYHVALGTLGISTMSTLHWEAAENDRSLGSRPDGIGSPLLACLTACDIVTRQKQRLASCGNPVGFRHSAL
jgi:hypothetical protein